VDEVRGTPWIWVINCGGMKSKEISNDFRKNLTETISREHSTTLQNIFFINTPMWMRLIVYFLKPFIHRDLSHKIHFLEGAGDLLFEMEGVHIKRIPWT